MENELAIRDEEAHLQQLIDEREKWKYASHPGMTNVEIQRRLDEMDAEIAKSKAWLKDFVDERRQILREMR